MVLTGKITGQFPTNSDTSKFFEIFKLLPSTLPNLIPTKVRSVELVEGQFGALGCCMFVQYTQDGVQQEAKIITEALDDEKKSITYTFVEGSVMQLYKIFVVTVCFDNNYVTLTIDFEKVNEEVPDPNDVLNFGLASCHDIVDQGLLLL